MSQRFDPISLPLHGLRLIEASAGTGKTFSLAGLYLRLVVEHRASVRDILVMTFTRAATQELRERIRARLADAARIAQRPEYADPTKAEHQFAQTILDNATDERAVLARRLRAAAARVDEATIVTIHGFAQRAAAENAFASALAFNRGEQVDDQTINRDISADYWREQIFGAGGNDKLLQLWPNPDSLYEAIQAILSKPHARLRGVDAAALQDKLHTVAANWPHMSPALSQALQAAMDADAIKSSAIKRTLQRYPNADAYVQNLGDSIRHAVDTTTTPVLDPAAAELATPAVFIDQRGNKKKACAQAFEQIDALQPLADLVALARIACVNDTVQIVRRRAREHKRAHRLYSYDDLIQALYNALHDPQSGEQLADTLYTRWPYALVDEFQDTDPLQYASLRRIYLDQPREHGALLLIGDPKQAIYGFRGGDIYAYLAAARTAGSERRYTLTTNYRSTQAVLDAIQALYKRPPTAPFVAPQIDFPTIEAGHNDNGKRLLSATGSCAGLTFWNLQGGQQEGSNGKRRQPTKDDNNARLIAHTVIHISRLLDGESVYWQQADGTQAPVTARDIAVLVNNHWEATSIQRQLAHSGIMAVCQHRSSVFGSPEAQELRLLLRALAAPGDTMAVRAAQTTAVIGKRLGELIALADDTSAMQQVVNHMQALHEAWAQRGVLTALEQLLMAVAPRLLALTDGERRMSNYLQLAELLASAEAQCFGMDSLVRWLDQRVADAAENSASNTEDQSQLRLESDANLVRITTVHAAKGLQYPIVIMPFALWLGTPKRNSPPTKPPLHFHDGDGNACIDLLGSDDQNASQAVIEARSEALRLLYVALTRAEQALFVGWRENDAKTAQSALADLLYRDTVNSGEACAALAQQHPAIQVETLDMEQPVATVFHHRGQDRPVLLDARSDLPEPRPNWSAYSFSRLARAAPDQTPEDWPVAGAEDEAAADHVSNHMASAAPGRQLALDPRLSGVRFGSAVHDVLEAMVGNPDRDVCPAPDTPCTAELRTLVQARLRQYGFIGDDDDDPRISETANLIARTLHTPLPEIGRLATLEPQRVRTEMGFMLRLGGNRLSSVIDTLRAAGYLPAALGERPGQTLYGLMQGFIDVVAETSGRYYILDYKTNRLGDTTQAYGPAELGRAIGAAHYDLQYLIYSVALHRHLRFSLGADYDPASHLGGVQYLFVRAMDGKSTTGVYSDKPDPALIDTLDRLFDTPQGMV